MAAPIVGRDAQRAELAAVVGLHAATQGRFHANHVSSASVTSALLVREPAPPLVVVYGGVSAGKSRCVAHALRASAEHFALVDCTGVMTTRAFYREVLGQLQSNARGAQWPRRSSGSGGGDGAMEDEATALGEPSDAEEDDDGGVTITGAPSQTQTDVESSNAAEEETRRPRRRRRRVEDERKGSESDDATGAESESDEERAANAASDGDAMNVKWVRPVNAPHEDGSGGVAVEKQDHGGADPAYGSLNFLSFVKALRGHMDKVVPAHGDTTHGPKPTVFVALDHVETLLERGFDKLLTCLLAVNDQLDYLHVFDPHGAPWRLCVILVARAVSLNLDLFLHGAHPAFIHFPAYTKEEVAAIVAQNLLGAADASVALDDNRERAAWLRKWLVGIYDLLPHCHNDWLEFQHVVVQMLPSFHAFFDLVSIDDHAPLPQLVGLSVASADMSGDGTANRSWVQLQRASRERIAALEKTRRRHLFGYDNVGAASSTAKAASLAADPTSAVAVVSSGDPVAFIASSKLSRSCQLLLIASYLASFTPHEADAHFVSSSGGLKRKRRIHRASGESGGANGAPGDATGNGKGGGSGKKPTSAASARKSMNQQLIGPKIFELPRLLAIYLSLQIENDALVEDAAAASDAFVGARSTRTRADIFTHLSLLVRLRLLQRASPPSDLDQPLFRCIADTRLVHEIARRLQFPLDSYLNTRG